MRTRVTENGITIPRSMLEGIDEVEIKQQGNRIVIEPVLDEDPIFRIGRNPVDGGVSDASVNLDKYIYTGK
ncbi:MAG TPA: hypothetical protein VK612_04875 [Pyrinomonadaceae bacterium]|nr:hypothetical protein [Pyrinomonadaceae bacterium]